LDVPESTPDRERKDVMGPGRLEKITRKRKFYFYGK